MTGQNETATDVHGLVAQRVEQYLEVRNKIKALDKEAEARKKPWVDIQNELADWIMNFLEKTGTTGAKTKAGTCYVSTRYQTSLADPEAFMNFVITSQNFDLLDRKANSTAVKEYVQEHSALPPGCNLSAIKSVGVRQK